MLFKVLPDGIPVKAGHLLHGRTAQAVPRRFFLFPSGFFILMAGRGMPGVRCGPGSAFPLLRTLARSFPGRAGLLELLPLGAEHGGSIHQAAPAIPLSAPKSAFSLLSAQHGIQKLLHGSGAFPAHAAYGTCSCR